MLPSLRPWWSILISSVWVAVSLPLMLPAAAENCPAVLCGGVNISFPFGIANATGQAPENSCDFPGFQVLCDNSTPSLGFNERNYRFQILDIFYRNGSLLVADVHKLQDFNASSREGCHAVTNNSSSKLGYPFSISPANRNLVFYSCAKAPPPGGGLVETVCRNNTFVRVAESYDASGSYGGYFLEGCVATMVPVLERHGKANASDYMKLISDGFLITWQLPLPPPPPGEFTLWKN